MPLDPAFVADCPYGPEALLLDDIVAIDRDAASIVARMPTCDELPLTRDQRAHPRRHPRHVSGALMIHATGMVGFAHAYYLLGLRHADGWIGYGTHIHDARFKKLATIGEPLVIECKSTSLRRIRDSLLARYSFRFSQLGATVYEGDQSAMWTRVHDA
jgi:hypothetical protein